jgi:thiol-disulfide isomerase/thioredoxin
MKHLGWILLGLAACAADVDVPFDGDQDGLLDSEELLAGTDPANPDSDGDNHLDGAEWFGGTDPTDADDYPYHGGYTINGDCREDILGGGAVEVDEIAGQFRLTDQFGDGVRLHDFCGQVVLLKRSAGWCGACRSAEPELVALYNDFKDQGFMAVTLMLEDDDSEVPSVEFNMAWAEQYGAKHPIVIDDEGYGGRFERDGGIPSYMLLDRGARILTVDQKPSHEQIQELLAQ